MRTLLLKHLSYDQIGQVVRVIETAIARSFAEDGARMTGCEIRRRYAICQSLIARLRGDLGWSLPRTLGYLPRYLHCELERIPWEPDARKLWAPDERVSNLRPVRRQGD